MKKLILKLTKIIILNLILVLVVNLVAPALLDSSTVRAIGDLSVDWGVPVGTPIFTIANMAPGQTEIRNVKVVNNSSTIRPVGVRGSKTTETNNLSTALNITISENTTDLYGGSSPTGPKTLKQFFDETALPNSIFLSNLNGGSSTIYKFTVTFNSTAGNEFQNSQTVFDLIIGISPTVPQECQNIVFSNDPIFGTVKGDNIKGTNGNDLIFGFEGGDSIDGKGGDDCIVGGAGGDSIKGGSGNDVILGEDGSDSIDGGEGNDKIYGGSGNDSLSGGAGNDQLFGGAGKDSLEGNGGNDVLIGGDIKGDYTNGNAGRDLCQAELTRNCEGSP